MLLEGKTYNSIKCIDIDFESGREEAFFDLSLSIRDCCTIYDCFDKYTEEELMDGDNKYNAEEHGMQRAKKVSHLFSVMYFYLFLVIILLLSSECEVSSASAGAPSAADALGVQLPDEQHGESEQTRGVLSRN